MTYKQDAPFAIQVELMLGCNLNCEFCGIRGIGFGSGANGYYEMPLEVALKTAKAIAEAHWTSRIEFARRGEPTLNANLFPIISVFRNQLPNNSLMMTTNGGGLLTSPQKYIEDLFFSGLNVLAIEEYEHALISKKIKERLDMDKLAALGIEVFYYPNNKRGNPHRRRKPDEKHLVFVADITRTSDGTHSVITNHGGYAGPLKEFSKPCAKPFRELSIDWNGSISHCCIAWAGEMICGNVLQRPLIEIWNNERFTAIRRKLLHGQRDFSTCLGCDHPSYRIGLLPDKFGQRKDAFPLPDEKTEAIIKEMDEEGPVIEQERFYLESERNFKCT